MERDLNGIVGIVARGNYALREVFAKVSQILMVANMDDEEWEELGGGEEGGGGVYVDVALDFLPLARVGDDFAVGDCCGALSHFAFYYLFFFTTVIIRRFAFTKITTKY